MEKVRAGTFVNWFVTGRGQSHLLQAVIRADLRLAQPKSAEEGPKDSLQPAVAAWLQHPCSTLQHCTTVGSLCRSTAAALQQRCSNSRGSDKILPTDKID